MAVVSLPACITPMLIGSALQSRLMWALLKPLIGFDPNEVNLFEVPIVKDRMTALLGEHYEPTMKLLRTAQEIQKEGPLIYVASRLVPTEFREIQDKAGLVWNSDTNQLAVVLIHNGVGQIFSEQNPGASTPLVPQLPKELQVAYDAARILQNRRESTPSSDDSAPNSLSDISEPLENDKALPEKATPQAAESPSQPVSSVPANTVSPDTGAGDTQAK
ncbi:conserved hypothetical protein [gamma proteobacterium HdN1]|nr:conserved hypothetical protein [gamma proteobacterium HdN1]